VIPLTDSLPITWQQNKTQYHKKGHLKYQFQAASLASFIFHEHQYQKLKPGSTFFG